MTQKEADLYKEAASRRKLAWSMHIQGASGAAIGRTLGVSRERVRQMLAREARIARRTASPLDDLSTRTANCVRSYFDHEPSVQEVREALERGAFSKVYGMGKKSVQEVADWLARFK